MARTVAVLVKSGLWDTCVHPLTANRAVIASVTHVDRLPDSWRDREWGTWTGEALIAAMSELDEGVSVVLPSAGTAATVISSPLIADDLSS